MGLAECEGTTAIYNPAILEGVDVFPNPTNGEVFISKLPENSTITITNALGQTVWEGKETVIDLTEQAAGIYFLTVHTRKGSNTYKVIKE